jgi:hypothetical protein
MPFDWRAFLTVAHELRNNTGEGVQRTCLGRVYYYVYHLGLTKAQALNFTEKPPGLHTKLWKWCERQTDPTIKRMGNHGLRMLARRISADYSDAPIPNLAHQVKTQLARAQQFETLVARSNGQTPPAGLAP